MGWAERANRRARNQRRLFDCAACRELAARLRSGLDAFDVTVSSAQPIGRMIADLEWIAGFRGEPFDAGGAREADPERFERAFLRSLQAHQMVELLQHADRVQHSQPVARKWIKKQIDRTQGTDSQAQDILFELEIAGRLALWHLNGEGLEVSLEEPDIVVRLPSDQATPPMALACKRPRSQRSIGDALHDARGQIGRAGMPGIIAVSLDAVLAEPTGAPTILTDDSGQAEELGRIRVRALVEGAEADIARERHPACLGVHFSANFIHRAAGRLGFFWVSQSVPDPAVPLAQQNLDMLDRLLFQKPVD